MSKFRLIDVGKLKIQIIKLVKTYSGLSLKESKDIVDNIPSAFFIDDTFDSDLIINDFAINGAKIELIDKTSTSAIPEKTITEARLRIRLFNTGFNKIELIKMIRVYTQLSLKECKNLIDFIPSEFEIKEPGISFSELKSKFEAIGAQIEKTSQTDESPIYSITEPDSDNKFRIKIISPGIHRNEVVKLIRLFTGLDIEESTKIIEQFPFEFLVEKTSYNFEQIQKNFEAIGASIIEIKDEKKPFIFEENKGIQTSQPSAAGYGENLGPTNSTIENQIINETVIKSNSELTNKDELFFNNQPLAPQNIDSKNAIIFTNLAAIIISLSQAFLYFHHFITIFIIAFIIAYLLRVKNPASQKLGIKAFALVLNYFIVKLACNTLILPFLLGYYIDYGFYIFIRMIFRSGNVMVLLAGVLAFVVASYPGILTNLNKKTGFIGKEMNTTQKINETKNINKHKEKLKF